MSIRDYLRVLRSRWRLITLCTLLGVAAAVGLTLSTPSVYRAEAQLFVSTSSGESSTGLQEGNQFAQQRVKSYADIVDSPSVTTAVIDELGLDATPQQLERRISAEAPVATVLINVKVDDGSPEQAQAIANAVADRFTAVAAQLETPEGDTASPVKVSVVRPADLPVEPLSPRPPLNLALGFILGLGLGLGLAALREALDTSIGGVDELRESLGLATLGVIAFDPDTPRQPLIVHTDPRSSRAEAFRQLRTNLQFVDIDSHPRSIVVTSSLPGEGKSTTAANLAIALTQAGKRVILVEADLRQPRVASYMGLEGAVGITDVLVGRADLDDVLQPWGDGNLRVLACGPIPPNPSELLSSQHMRVVLRALEESCDLVLLDAPPLLPVTDAAVLAVEASGAIVIVRSNRTRRDHALRAVETLRGVGAQVFGAVITMAPTKGPNAYRYGYYGATYAATPAPGRTPSGAHEEDSFDASTAAAR